MDLTHVDASNQPRMVDVGEKTVTRRMARARAVVHLGAEIMAGLQGGDLHAKKGPVFQTAIIAGTMAAKRTSEAIPFCHLLPLERCKIQIQPLDAESVEILCETAISHKTGVEMEALHGASVAALTIYDMCKALSLTIEIRELCLVAKNGGRRDYERAQKTSSAVPI
ncbi:MAG TPA: cyclic pyranopterin monophosphate synthase MoaC [Lentisphaeria bacterium]|nr:cyclic pyranopterin monophosphate synthase MoaC [Lentisphaeria bacterium]